MGSRVLAGKYAAAARTKRSRIPSSTWCATPFASFSGLPLSRAWSARATAGSIGVPAGRIPVYGAPSPARWIRTRFSKKYWSASARASGPFPRTASVRAKIALISGSAAGLTHFSTGVISPFSSASLAAVTTGPSAVSQ